MSKHKPASRKEIIDYCFRQLGSPVVDINVSYDQAEDCVESALQFCREFHFDMSFQTYLKETITASTMNVQSGNGLSFQVGDTITGSTSNSTCIVHALIDANSISVKNVSGTFIDGEPITSNKSALSGTLAASNSVVLGNFDKRYFEVSDSILSITKALPMNSYSSGAFMFDVRYQLFLNSMPTLTSFDLAYYNQLFQYLNLINDYLTGIKPVRFSRHMNKLFIDFDWNRDIAIGDILVFECYQYIDGEQYTDVYNDWFLKRYLTSLIKKQWGANMKKFEGIQLPGGITMKGQEIYNEAIQELQELKTEVENTYQLPTDFFVG